MSTKKEKADADHDAMDQTPKRRRSTAGQASEPNKAAARTNFKSRDAIVAIGKDGAVQVNCKAGDKPFGSDDDRFLMGLVNQIINASSKGGEIDKSASDFALSVVQAIDPRDEIEAMLAAQMAAVQLATMTFTRRLNHVTTTQQQDSAGSLFVKLARTLPLQMEALKKYRSGVEQRITVQHVTVNDGGQAVVGNISAGSKANEQAGGGNG